MFDKELFEKICNADCSFDELADFCHCIDKKEFDTDNPFEKYYSLKRIISVIEKYQADDINDTYLACWMTAYNWIIMGGFKSDNKSESVSLKEFIVLQISDWMDSLSFFDLGGEFDLEQYKEVFKTLDAIYHDCDNCEAMFTQYGHNDNDIVVLVSNRELKYYAKVCGELDFAKCKTDFEQVKINQIRNSINRLSELGYTKLFCGSYGDDFFE